MSTAKLEVDFDDYAARYRDDVQRAIGFLGQRHDFYLRVKADHLLRTLRVACGDPCDARVLDIGCGGGDMTRMLVDAVGEVRGIDVSAEQVDRARAAVPNAQIDHYDGAALPYADGEFDAAFAVCVMHHVPPGDWEPFAAEMIRVVRPGGLVAVYEHNPFNPLTRLSVARCEFDRDATLLSSRRTCSLLRRGGLSRPRTDHLLFTPFAASWIRRLEDRLSWLPCGAQYAVTGIR